VSVILWLTTWCGTSEAEFHGVRDGDDAYYDGSPPSHIRLYPDEFMATWIDFELRLKHEVRFFDESGRRSLDELFEELPTIAGGKAIVTIEPGSEFSTLYRARIASGKAEAENFLKEPERNLGPPPYRLARPGRMNPVGIPAFYGAFAEEVAIAEVRPPVGALVAIARFALKHTVRLLDVSFLPFAYHEESIFSPAYDHLRNKVGFLERFHRHIIATRAPERRSSGVFANSGCGGIRPERHEARWDDLWVDADRS